MTFSKQNVRALTQHAQFRRHLARVPILVTLLALSSPQKRLGAQSATGSLQGTVFDSLTSRPLAGALVEVSGSSQMATTDAQGRFRIDSVSAGAHRVSFSATELDSIGLFGFARDVQVRANAVEQVSLATPSFKTMYTQLCAPAAVAPTDSAIVFGTVYDASTGARVDSARVHFVWQATSVVDKQVRLVDYSRDARAASSGDYGVCGLPAEVLMTTQALTPRTASGRVITAIGASRIIRRDIYVSSEMPAEAGASPARGAGVVRGRVRDTAGVALVNANVRLASADTIVQTDSAGHFTFANAPLGTQHVEARLTGRAPAFSIVHVRRDEQADAEIIMFPLRATNNASGRPRIGPDQATYLAHKETGRGEFVDRQLILAQPSVGSVLRLIGGLSISFSDIGIDVQSMRGRCMPTFVINGQRTTQSDVAIFRGMAPRQLMALEYYDDPAAVPADFSKGARIPCGMLVLWTTAARW